MNQVLVFWAMMVLLSACNNTNMMVNNLDIQGHRGCRGLLPENTIEGFVKAVDLGVNTLELDVVISADSQVIVSHEAFFNHEISTLENGDTLSKKTEKTYNIYKMLLADTQKIDVGMKPIARFPLQSKQKAFKPTLKQVVDSVENYIALHKLPTVKYNIEIKHQKSLDHEFNPTAEVFTKMIYDEITNLGIKTKCNIQSFDPECINIIHRIDSTVATAFLVENRDSYLDNLKKLDFTPTIYSPYFLLVNPELIAFGRKQNIRIIPWTINEEKDMITYINMGIDGIITDYPDKAIEIYEGMRMSKK